MMVGKHSITERLSMCGWSTVPNDECGKIQMFILAKDDRVKTQTIIRVVFLFTSSERIIPWCICRPLLARGKRSDDKSWRSSNEKKAASQRDRYSLRFAMRALHPEPAGLRGREPGCGNRREKLDHRQRPGKASGEFLQR